MRMAMAQDGQAPTDGALAGVRVLDLSRVLAGPYCAMTLGNLGADVVKVERPGSGDDTRRWGPPFVGGEAAYYLSCNSSKRGVTVDLARAEGRALVRDLAARADVLIENYKAGAADAWGLGYETLAAANPGLIYCSIRGFHSDGPYGDRPGYDFIAQALGGIMSVTGEPDGAPAKVGIAIVDITTGLYAVAGILAALHARTLPERGGRGQRVEVNLLDAAAGWLANLGQSYLVTGDAPGRYGNAHPTIVPYQTFQAADGYMAVAVGNDGQWQKLCASIERPDLAADARYATNPRRVASRDELVPDLAATFRARPVADWVQRLTAVAVPCGVVNTIAQVFEAPGLLGPDMLAALPHPTLGSVRVVNTPIGLSATPAAPRRAPPTLGQHTDEALGEWLGLDADEIAALLEKGIV